MHAPYARSPKHPRITPFKGARTDTVVTMEPAAQLWHIVRWWSSTSSITRIFINARSHTRNWKRFNSSMFFPTHAPSWIQHIPISYVKSAGVCLSDNRLVLQLQVWDLYLQCVSRFFFFKKSILLVSEKPGVRTQWYETNLLCRPDDLLP